MNAHNYIFSKIESLNSRSSNFFAYSAVIATTCLTVFTWIIAKDASSYASAMDLMLLRSFGIFSTALPWVLMDLKRGNYPSSDALKLLAVRGVLSSIAVGLSLYLAQRLSLSWLAMFGAFAPVLIAFLGSYYLAETFRGTTLVGFFLIGLGYVLPVYNESGNTPELWLLLVGLAFLTSKSVSLLVLRRASQITKFSWMLAGFGLFGIVFSLMLGAKASSLNLVLEDSFLVSFILASIAIQVLTTYSFSKLKAWAAHSLDQVTIIWSLLVDYFIFGHELFIQDFVSGIFVVLGTTVCLGTINQKLQSRRLKNKSFYYSRNREITIKIVNPRSIATDTLFEIARLRVAARDKHESQYQIKSEVDINELDLKSYHIFLYARNKIVGSALLNVSESGEKTLNNLGQSVSVEPAAILKVSYIYKSTLHPLFLSEEYDDLILDECIKLADFIGCECIYATLGESESAERYFKNGFQRQFSENKNTTAPRSGEILVKFLRAHEGSRNNTHVA